MIFERYRKWAEIECSLFAMRRLMANGVDSDAMMMRGRVRPAIRNGLAL